MAWWAAWHMHMHADFTSTSELPFASLKRVLVLNVSHENDLIFMRMNVLVTYIFIPIVSHIDSFCHRGKSKLGIGLCIHELLREPLISLSLDQFFIRDIFEHKLSPHQTFPTNIFKLVNMRRHALVMQPRLIFYSNF